MLRAILTVTLISTSSLALADPAFAPYSDGIGMKVNGSHRAIGGSSMLPQPRYRGPEVVYRMHELPDSPRATAPALRSRPIP